MITHPSPIKYAEHLMSTFDVSDIVDYKTDSKEATKLIVLTFLEESIRQQIEHSHISFLNATISEILDL